MSKLYVHFSSLQGQTSNEFTFYGFSVARKRLQLLYVVTNFTTITHNQALAFQRICIALMSYDWMAWSDWLHYPVYVELICEGVHNTSTLARNFLVDFLTARKRVLHSETHKGLVFILIMYTTYVRSCTAHFHSFAWVKIIFHYFLFFLFLKGDPCLSWSKST